MGIFLLLVPALGASIYSGPATFRSHDYYVVSAQTWAAAEAEAMALGGHLVAISDQAEQDFVSSFIEGWTTSHWTGFTDQASEGDWVWANGELVSYTNWNPGEPNDSGGIEDCGVIEVAWDGAWNDLPCDRIHPGIVEVDTAVGYWRFEEGAPNAPAIGEDSIPDWSAGLNAGDPLGWPIYRADVAASVIPLTNAANSLSLEFDGDDDEVSFDSHFPFHGVGDATVELWVYITQPGHRALLWTRSDDIDENRFNFYVHDGHFGFDYRTPGGERHILVDHVPGEMVWIGYDRWAHVAIARSGNGYKLYVDGVLRRTAVDPSPDLPTVSGWRIAGRDGYFFGGKVDEVRFSGRELTPAEFLICLGPEDQIGRVIEDVSSLNVEPGIVTSWNAMLDAALEVLEDENDRNDVAAVRSLQAFINAVAAHRGRWISEADADALITAALGIIDQLSGG